MENDAFTQLGMYNDLYIMNAIFYKTAKFSVIFISILKSVFKYFFSDIFNLLCLPPKYEFVKTISMSPDFSFSTVLPLIHLLKKLKINLQLKFCGCYNKTEKNVNNDSA